MCPGLGIELSFLGLAAITFTTEPSHQPSTFQNYYYYLFYVYVYMCVCVCHVWGCLQRSEEVARVFGAGVKGSCELPDTKDKTQVLWKTVTGSQLTSRLSTPSPPHPTPFCCCCCYYRFFVRLILGYAFSLPWGIPVGH